MAQTVTVDRVKERRSGVAGYRPGMNGSRPLDAGEAFVNREDKVRCIGNGDGTFIEYDIRPMADQLDDGPLSAALAGKVAADMLATLAAPGKSPQFLSVDGSGIPGINVTGQGLIFRHVRSTGKDAHTFRIDRFADYAPGTAKQGFENTALLVNNYVTATAASYEDAALFRLDSTANDMGGFPQHSVARFVGVQRGSAPVWIGAIELYDQRQINVAPGTCVSPTTGLIGWEMVLGANGPDNNGQRVAIDIISARPFTDDTHEYKGELCTIGAGMRLTRQVADGAQQNRFERGILFGASATFKTDFGVGIDFTGATFATGGAAILLGQGNKLALDSNNSRTLDFDAGSLNYRVSNSARFQVDDQGFIKIQGGQVLVSKRTGWNSPTGTLTRGAFDASTTSLATVAQTLAALITDLRAHGLIGT